MKSKDKKSTENKKIAKTTNTTAHKPETQEKDIVSTTGGTFIAFCGRARCDSQFQDKTYGTDIRVFNKKKDGKQGTCTVCESIKDIKS